jgi:thymidylate synthase (FAD)
MIDVKLISPPTVQQFRDQVAVFMMNTWNDELKHTFPPEKIDKCIRELFAGNILPTGMEIINLTFTIEGMNVIDTTHLIRHRMFSFSAQTQADRDMRNDVILLSPQIEANPDYAQRFAHAAGLLHDLYMDMVDSKQVDMLEARTVLPMAYEKFYICRGTIKDIIAYCKLRSDEQIQPYADVIIAMKLWLKVLRVYPFLKGLVDFRDQDTFYVKQCSNGKTNIFPPLPKNDTFEWAETQFVYDKPRNEFPGYAEYNALREMLLMEIDAI